MDINEAISLSDQLVEEAASTLMTPFKIPQFTGVATKENKVELERVKKTRDSTQALIDVEQTKITEANTKTKDALDAEAIAKGARALADTERANQIADVNKLADLIFNIDPSSDIALKADQVRQERATARGMLDTLKERQSVAITDNPLEWLFNQIAMPQRVQAYNRQADIVDSLQNGIDEGIKTAQNLAARYERGIPTTTSIQAKAIADLALADAAKAKIAADLALSKTNVDFATRKLSEDLAVANATRDTSTLEFQNARTKYESLVMEINLTEKRSERQIKAATLLNELGQSQALDALLRNYDNVIGNPQGTTNRQLFNKLPPSVRENIAAMGAGKGGADPYDFLINIRNLRPGSQMSKETQSLILWLNQQAAAQATAVDKMITDQKLTKDQREIKIGQNLSAVIEAQRELAYQPGTLFHEVEPGKLLASGAILPNSILAKALLPLTQQTGPITPEIIVATIDKAYQSNPTITGQVVAEYYQRNLKFMNSAANFQLAGIKPMNSYTVPLSFGPFVSKTFDLTKPEEATKYILFKQFKEKIPNLGAYSDVSDPIKVMGVLKNLVVKEIKSAIPGAQ